MNSEIKIGQKVKFEGAKVSFNNFQKGVEYTVLKVTAKTVKLLSPNGEEKTASGNYLQYIKPA